MYTFLAVLYVVVSIVLIVIVLMQSQQSMNLSGMFGGASQSALGSQPQSILNKTTTVLAIIFMLLSLLFSLIPRSEESILSPQNLPVDSQQSVPESQDQPAPSQQETPGPSTPQSDQQSPRNPSSSG